MEYVNKKSLKPKKELFNDAIKYVRGKLEDYSFNYRLVGSAKRNMVLRHHNKGYDLDYQIIFYESIANLDLGKIKEDFIEKFNDFFVPKGYDHADDSTSAITIKYLDGDKIDHSYDVVLLSPEDVGLKIIKYIDEEKTELNLKLIKKSKSFNDNFKKMKGNGKWNELRTIYKNKKENNTQGKKSFSLFIESVNEVIK